MNQYRFPGWFIIPGCFLIFLALTGSVHATPSVDLTLTPSHIPPFSTNQPPFYAFGEPVVVKVSLTNQGSDPITVMGSPPRRGISHRNQTDFLIFQRSTGTAAIGPGRTLIFDFTWDQKDAQGLQVDSGLYTVGVYYLLSKNTAGDWDISHADPYTRTVDIIVLPKAGALTTDIPVNQSQVMDNVSVTLESIHVTNTTGQVNFTVQVPEDIQYRTHPAGWKMCYLDFISIEAQYSIDHDSPREFYYRGQNCDPPHTFRSMYEMDPIPADAHEMEINLTASGSHRGSWIFHVNLTPTSPVPGNAAGSSRPTSPSQPTPLSSFLVTISLCCSAAGYALIRMKRERS
ncbi:MAG: hypothetical protein WC391_05865 [Methanoregula sp.]|jgi:hypothetical protein